MSSAARTAQHTTRRLVADLAHGDAVILSGDAYSEGMPILSPGHRTVLVRLLALAAALLCCFAMAAAPAAASPEKKTLFSESAAESEALQQSAEDNYISTWADVIGTTVESGDKVYVAPGFESFWDERQQKLAAPMVKLAEDAGYHVTLLVLPATVAEDRAGNDIEPAELERIWQEIFNTVAREHDLDSVVFASWSAVSGELKTTVYRDQQLITEVGGVISPAELNDDVPGPWFRYSLRRAVDPSVSSPEQVELSPDPWFGSRRPEDIVRIDQGAVHWAIPLGAAAGSLIAFPLSAGWSWWGAFRRKRSAARRESDDELKAVRKAGVKGELLVQRRVQAALSPKSSSERLAAHDRLRKAAEVLPAAADSENPLVWVAWARLAEEARSVTKPTRCFFRPDRRAESTRYWSGLGDDLLVPVSRDVREQLDAGDEPSFLSERGIDVDRPYFTHDTAFARSGFGAFGSLAEALADSAGSFAQNGKSVRPKAKRGARTFDKLLVTVATAFAIAAVVGGIAGAGVGYLIDDRDTSERARSASNAYSEQAPSPDEADRSLHDQIAADAADDSVAVAPEALLGIAPEDIAELSEKVQSMPHRTALLIWENPSAAPFLPDRNLLDEQLVVYSGYEIVLRANPGFSALHNYHPDLSKVRDEAPEERDSDLPVLTAYMTELDALTQAAWEGASTRTGYTDMQHLSDTEPIQPLPGTAQFAENRRIGLRKSALLAIPAVPIGLIAAFLVWNTDHDRLRRYRESKR